LKYHCFAQKNITGTTYKLDNILPNKIKLRENEILQLEPKDNLLLGSESLRQSYEHLILACGLEPDYSEIPGLLYSLQDNNDPIFTSFEYETVIPKICIYSAILINQIKYDFGKNLPKKNLDFLNNGNGNIVFTTVSSSVYDILENMQMIILLHDLILYFRKQEFRKKLKFILCVPSSKENFINQSKELNTYFVKLLEERNIEIYWNHKLKEVGSDHVLKFTINKTKMNEENDAKIPKSSVDIEYNYAYVIPKLTLPSFNKYSTLFDDCKNNKIDIKNLKINGHDNIYMLGDALAGLSLDKLSDNSNLIEGSFLDRFYSNIQIQADVISNNLKANHFRLGKSHLREYKPEFRVYFDFMMKNYLIFDTNTGFKEFLKKSRWNNFLFKHLYFRPEGFYARRMLLRRKFGFKI